MTTTPTKTKAIIALLDARPGKEHELHELLRGARELADRERTTLTWYAVKAGPTSFAIFDTFADEAGRTAHLEGAIAAALLGRADELLARAPDIRKVDVIAAKTPVA